MEKKIKAVMSAVFDVDAESIDDNSSPDTIANWDSLRHMSLIVGLEEEFGVNFTEDDISTMLNYKLIALTIAEHANKK